MQVLMRPSVVPWGAATQDGHEATLRVTVESIEERERGDEQCLRRVTTGQRTGPTSLLVVNNRTVRKDLAHGDASRRVTVLAALVECTGSHSACGGR